MNDGASFQSCVHHPYNHPEEPFFVHFYKEIERNYYFARCSMHKIRWPHSVVKAVSRLEYLAAQVIES